ncbi:type IV pili twitching motility protein PilT [Helicobacter sp. MIT 14-3879]|nr:type IV pili twitching motility protein PilT [Helicobacter sp. MIT 14-3879]
MKEAQIKESNVLNNINRVNNTTPNISQNLNKQVSSINQIPTLSQATKSEVELTHNSIKKTSNIEVTHPQEQNIQDTKKQKQDTLKNKNDLENDSTIGRVQDIHIEPNIVKEDLTFRNPNIESLRVNVNQLDFAVTRRVRVYLKKLIDIGGSDLHLKAGAKIRARINGDIIIFSDDIFSKDDAITFAKELTRTRYTEFVSNKEMDMTYIYDVSNRFRVNMFFQMDGVSFAFRTIPTTQNTIDGLGLPKAIHNIVDMERGLVLVTGITGSGKSTTLASIINEINHKHAKHIITIEDPIEFIHKDMKSIINQRSVGMDTNSFASALKAALREDPDIILVGEMRDIETIEMALHAAETGHLVLSTLHTIDSKETINRIVSVFPTHDQTRIRATLASTLNAVVSQRLLKNKDGGRTAAIELLFRTPRIELIINEGRDGEILEALSEGKDIYHTQTFDQHLFELITNGIVDEDMALEKATSSSDLKLKLKNISFAGKNEEGDSITIKR